ncbi:hypothetical protein O9929_19545 [Vibrio lentus]|nr:hypothetical protein [Vibrio lentus]
MTTSSTQRKPPRSSRKHIAAEILSYPITVNERHGSSRTESTSLKAWCRPSEHQRWRNWALKRAAGLEVLAISLT